MNESEFLGEPISFWIDLRDRGYQIPNLRSLLTEIRELRAKVSFYESRIDQMMEIKGKDNG